MTGSQRRRRTGAAVTQIRKTESGIQGAGKKERRERVSSGCQKGEKENTWISYINDNRGAISTNYFAVYFNPFVYRVHHIQIFGFKLPLMVPRKASTI